MPGFGEITTLPAGFNLSFTDSPLLRPGQSLRNISVTAFDFYGARVIYTPAPLTFRFTVAAPASLAGDLASTTSSGSLSLARVTVSVGTPGPYLLTATVDGGIPVGLVINVRGCAAGTGLAGSSGLTCVFLLICVLTVCARSVLL
jgi:hypothetical protein